MAQQQAEILQTMEAKGVDERTAIRILQEATLTTRSKATAKQCNPRYCNFHGCQQQTVTNIKAHGANLCTDHLALVQPHVGVFEVRASTIPGAGLGLFAVRTVHSPYMLHYKGVKLTKVQKEALPATRRSYTLGHGNKFIDASAPLSCLARYINHSSTKFNVQMIPAQGDKYIIQVLDEIKKGCEVLSNYGDDYWGPQSWAGDHHTLASQSAMRKVPSPRMPRSKSPQQTLAQREVSDDSDFDHNHSRAKKKAASSATKRGRRKRGRPTKQSKAAKKTKQLSTFFKAT